MKRYRRLATGAIGALGVLGFISGIVQAQTPANARIARGAVIAAQGTVAGAPPCAQCHAFNGISDASGAFPRVAGQSAYYLAEQLRDFASERRSNAFMTPIAKALTADDIAERVARLGIAVASPLCRLAVLVVLFGITYTVDRSAYDGYNGHPEHVRFVEERWLVEVADFLELDYAPLP